VPARVALAVFLLVLPAFAVMKARQHDTFPLSRAAAIKAASSDWRARHFLDREHYTRVRISPVDGRLERITFLDGYKIVTDVAIDHRGHVERAIGREGGSPESGSRVANRAPVLILFLALFVLATATVPLVSLRNLDVLAMASLTVPIWLVNHMLVEPSVWAAYPPLIYLAARCLGMGLGRPRGEPGRSLYWHLASRWPAEQRKRVLKLVVAAMATIVAVVVPTSEGASDVCFAAVAGATDLLHGVIPYGHIPNFIVHGDTYPLLTYVAYLPAAAVMPVRDLWDDPTGGLVITAAATLLAAAGMYRIGVRLGRGAAGEAERGAGEAEPPSVAGMRLTLAFLSFPPVVLAASSGANDAVLAACLVAVFVWFDRVRASAALLAVAAWVKVIPVLALPIWLARMPRRAALQAVGVIAALSGALLGVLVALAGPGAVPAMLKALTFQLQRSSLHSLWEGLHLPALQPPVEAALIAAIAAAVVAVRRDESLRGDLCRVAALLAGIELIALVAANYWTWAYMPWVAVPVLLSLLAPARGAAPHPACANHLPRSRSRKTTALRPSASTSSK
jgi:hypothetical protein